MELWHPRTSSLIFHVFSLFYLSSPFPLPPPSVLLGQGSCCYSSTEMEALKTKPTGFERSKRCALSVSLKQGDLQVGAGLTSLWKRILESRLCIGIFGQRVEAPPSGGRQLFIEWKGAQHLRKETPCCFIVSRHCITLQFFSLLVAD